MLHPGSRYGPGVDRSETADVGGLLPFLNAPRSVSLARRAVRERLVALGLERLSGSAEVVVTELLANAVLHTGGPMQLEIRPLESGIRLSVFDTSPLLPVVPTVSQSSMTGRGLLLVRGLSARFGFEPTADGKVVWAELRSERLPGDVDADELIDAWADDWDEPPPANSARHRIELGDVPTDLLLAAKSHVDNLVREFLLAAAGAESGSTASVPPHLAELIETVVYRFSEARLSIKRQALDADRRGLRQVRLHLELGPDAADAGEDYLRALDEADAYCRAARLLTLETPPRQRVFRHWYVGELVAQLRRADAGLPSLPAQHFEDRLLDEIDTVATARGAAERAARLYTVTSALAGAMTAEAVAEAVLSEGVAALAASGGGLLLPAGSDRLAVPGTVGYDERLVESLRAESSAAELPAAVVVRTGQAVWLESREERDTRFPELVDFEKGTVSMCVVPLHVGDRLLGALRFSFSQQRLFDQDERRFVLALAAQAAQALDRAHLYQDRSELAQRLQRSLLPPELPAIPGIDLAAVHHPLGDGIEVGGDFYDVWAITDTEWAFALGDVCGTGPEAGGLTALVRYSLRAITTHDPHHAALLSRLNDVLLGVGTDDDERFCTVVFGTIHLLPGGFRLRIATGGHPEPVVQRMGGETCLIAAQGSLLGILPSVEVAVEDITLGTGDRIVFYTDGVTEARSATRMFGIDGLLEAIRQAPDGAAATATAIERAVLGHSGGRLSDDMAILVLRALPE